ncbi:hypothetical protein [Pseudonocardia endophytica]|uniref:Uncharacterized protein n=1 Tax=Pseudonocardia endophytica TaxID=401976 RepID=A0A4R1I858_PSEEN|nr:hypothetical protein [Pseudonocardia endophytica]TCK26332.1 hypothetical protein EV378_2163 [Pseudonocardia endophytica]
MPSSHVSAVRPTPHAPHDRAIRESLSFEDYLRLTPGRRRRRGGDLTDAERSALDRLPGPLDVLAHVQPEAVPPALSQLGRLASNSSRVRLHVVVGTRAGGDDPLFIVLDADGAELGVLDGGRARVIDDLASLVQRTAS